MTFKKTCRSKSNLDTILCQFLYFICIVTFDKLSKLQQISCKFLIKWQYKIPKSSQEFKQSFWKLAQMESTCFKTLK